MGRLGSLALVKTSLAESKHWIQINCTLLNKLTLCHILCEVEGSRKFMPHLPQQNSVFLNKTGFSVHTINNFSLSPINVTSHIEIPTEKGKKLALVIAISMEWVLAYELIDSSCDLAKSLTFLTSKLVPIVFMDNVKTYHVQSIKEFLHDQNICIKFLLQSKKFLRC